MASKKTKSATTKKEKRKLVESKAESCSPCKVSKFRQSDDALEGQDKVLWINNNTRIDDAPDTLVDFVYNSGAASTSMSSPKTTIKNLENVKVNGLVTVKGLVTFGSNTPEQAGSTGLTKLEGFIIDESDCISLTIWNDDIKCVQDGKRYVAENLRLRQYQGVKYLTSTRESNFKLLKEDELQISPELIETAATKLQLKCREVKCFAMTTVEIIDYYSCVKCHKRIQSCPDSKVAKCENCNIRFLLEKSTKNKMARVSMKTSDTEEDQWFSLFNPALQEIINHYNITHELERNEALETIEEEKLSEIILLSEDSMTLMVNNANNGVNLVKFSKK
ncbi:Hypothetical predicted protein [Paramuricea clavata]|uniref:Uncharacterized protein n=1 Tax=Paramuricea clavata TaxID=317549 RepID=A0A6S7GTG1_PARCT|nr:Hypothetical predicted protein [Paramuricea clavata]